MPRSPLPQRAEMTDDERLEWDRWTEQKTISPRGSEPRHEAIEELRLLRVRILSRMRDTPENE